VTDCLVGPPPAPPSPGPISLTAADAIVCINTEPRENPTGDAILLVTFGANGNYIYLNNSGTLTATFAGIRARTESNYSPIDIVNSGEIAVTADSFTGASGIQAVTYFNNDSDISIVNTADITAYGGTGFGISAAAYGQESSITLVNSGDVTVVGTEGRATGIFSYTRYNAATTIENRGDIQATTTSDYADAFGILALTIGYAPISIVNSGDITVHAGEDASGIRAFAGGPSSGITIENTGRITSTTDSKYADGISAGTFGPASDIAILNQGPIDAGHNAIIARSL